MCFFPGEAVFPDLNTLLFQSLVTVLNVILKSFLWKIWKFYSCFQLTFFRFTKIDQNNDGHNFQTTFNIQVQKNHKGGTALMNLSNKKCIPINSFFSSQLI